METNQLTLPLNSDKDGIAVYCKCGGILFAATYAGYTNDPVSQSEFEGFWNKGYKVGRVNTTEVQTLFGCKCATPNSSQTGKKSTIRKPRF